MKYTKAEIRGAILRKTAEPTVITSYKAFDANWKCRDFQYEVGKSYEHTGTVEACKSGFHACENPLDMLHYYPLVGSKFAEVEQSGTLARHEGDSKVASGVIKVKAEINIAGIVKASVAWISKKAAAPTSGNSAHSDLQALWMGR